MISLISVNKKFMDVSPKELVEMISSSEHVKGIEFCVSDFNQLEEKYLDDIVFELKKHNLILQVHGSSLYSLEKQYDFLKKMEYYANYLEQQIVLTMHPLYDEDKNISQVKTSLYFDEVIKHANNEKVVICIENLNDIPNYDRLEKESIKPIVLNNEKLFFTYDIGHEIMDYGNITNLDSYVISKIKNVHLHSHDVIGNDHLPIYENDKYFSEILKAILFLINNKYCNAIVFEYNIFACRGNTIKEKVQDFLDSVDFVALHY